MAEIKNMNYELYHHGIKGQKWGIRRFQNPDGTLTEAGKKHYDRSSGKQIHRELKKQIRRQRSEINGSANRWMSKMPIGEHSKKIVDEAEQNEAKYKNSDEYKRWEKKLNSFDKRWAEKDIADYSDYEKYETELNSIIKEKPKEPYNTLYSAKTLTNRGWVYMNDYINKGGKDLSIAYLQDLGYNQKVAEQLVKKMAREKVTLGDI